MYLNIKKKLGMKCVADYISKYQKVLSMFEERVCNTNVAAKLFMAVILSGCSSPRSLFHMSRPLISSFSASAYFPKN